MCSLPYCLVIGSVGGLNKLDHSHFTACSLVVAKVEKVLFDLNMSRRAAGMGAAEQRRKLSEEGVNSGGENRCP